MASSAMFSLPDEPRILNRRTPFRNSSGSSPGSMWRRKVRLTSMLETTIGAWNSSPFASATPVTRLLRTRKRSTPAPGPDLAAGGLERSTQRAADRTHAAAREAPGADRAVHVAHIVVQQHIGRARRVDAQPGADDPAAGQMRLDHRRLEELVEKVADRHGPKADRLAHLALAQVVEAPAEEQQLADVARAQRHGIGRRAQQQRPDEPALAHHGMDVALVIVGVAAEKRCISRRSASCSP